MPNSIVDSGPGWLFVPADRPERYEKAIAASDLTIIDLEDAVRADAKDAAREMLASSNVDPARVCVRVNGFDSGHIDRDLEAVRSIGVTNVVLPKAHSDQPFEMLEGLSVVALIETARGVLDAEQISAVPLVAALALGSADLMADLHVRMTEASVERVRELIDHARTQILYGARAHGKRVVDSVWTAVRDEEGLAKETESAVAKGFDGKLAIHPSQMKIIRTAFASSPQELAWAKKVLAEAEARGEGAFVLDGELIDEAIVKRTHLILERAH